MNKLFYTALLLIAFCLSSRAQSFNNHLLSRDSINLSNPFLKLKIDSGLLLYRIDPMLIQKYKPQPNSSITSSLNNLNTKLPVVTASPVDHMPIAMLQSTDHMPVASLGNPKNFNMPIKQLGAKKTPLLKP